MQCDCLVARVLVTINVKGGSVVRCNVACNAPFTFVVICYCYIIVPGTVKYKQENKTRPKRNGSEFFIRDQVSAFR